MFKKECKEELKMGGLPSTGFPLSWYNVYAVYTFQNGEIYDSLPQKTFGGRL